MNVAVRRVIDPEDAALGGLSRLMHATFADPDTVLELERMQAFLAEHSSRTAGRQFCVVAAEEDDVVLGGTVFSYVPASNCGFSEYLLVRKDRHGQRIGRLLFDARRAVLDELALASTQTACSGLFIEADSPERTPSELLARERETAMDALTRLQVFAHLGFRRVAIDYVQPPLGLEKQPVSYLDLLFASWAAGGSRHQHVPAAWVGDTLCAIWRSWAPATASEACAALRKRLGDSPVALLPLPA